MQVVVDSLLTRYSAMGKGKSIVLLHGWGDSAAGLAQLQTALSEHYHVVAPDLPGFGGTQAPASAWGLDDYAKFVEHFLQKIGVTNTYAVVGHSNGAAMAIRGLAGGVLHADKVVIIGGAGIRNVYKGRVKLMRFVAKAGKALTSPLPATVKERLRKKVYASIGSDMLVAEHLQETFKRVVTDDVRADAAQLTMPVLLVYGQNDDATPVWYGEQFHELMVDSTLQVVPGAGHFVHLDQSDTVHRLIREFLQ